MSSIKRFRNNVLKLKQAKFKDVVIRASKRLSLSVIPAIEFWDNKCPYDGGNEWAHIHLDMYIICVSSSKLEQMSFDKIEETAIHEVSHMIEASHDSKFHKVNEETTISSWRPPGAGIVHITSRNSNKDELPKKKTISKPSKIYCNYHLCKKKTKLIRCSFCEGYYCNDHSNPKEPKMIKIGENDDDVLGHPCFDYTNYLIKQNEIKEKKYAEALASITSKNKKTENSFQRTYYSKNNEENGNDDEEGGLTYNEINAIRKELEKSEFSLIKLLKTIGIICLILIFVFLIIKVLFKI